MFEPNRPRVPILERPMRTIQALVLCLAVLLPVHLLKAQSPSPAPLSATPARVVGQVSVTAVGSSDHPNLVEGREMWRPNAVAIDTSMSPPALYVSDSGNNRVLGWRNAASFNNGAFADIVVGQRDLASTYPLGPGTSLSRGLNYPTGLAVDAQGNLYVVDAQNNRILRYPKPFADPNNRTNPDVVIGQPDFTSNKPNRGLALAGPGGIAALPTNPDSHPVTQQLALDAHGNLWFTDTGNHRVLRFPKGSDDKAQGTADIVLGQLNMNSSTSLPISNDGFQNKTGLRYPVGVTFDPAGRIYVADGLGRVLVYSSSPLPAATAAIRLLGLVRVNQGQPAPSRPNTIEFGLAMGLVMIGNNLGVIDQGWSRISIFDPFDQWPADAPTASSPPAKFEIGQVDFSTNKPGASANSLRSPAAAAFSGTELFVADTYNNRVVVFPQSALTTNGSAASRVLGQFDFGFYAPNLIEGRELYLFSTFYNVNGVGGVNFTDSGGVAIDTKTEMPHLYIADTYNNRVLGFRDARKVRPGDKADVVIGQRDLFSANINGDSNDPNQPNDTGLYFPAGLAVDEHGNLYVADRGNGRVLRFPAPLDQPVTAGLRANLVLGQQNFTSENNDVSRFNMAAPYGVAIMPEGHVLVSDMTHHRVLMFRKPSGGDFGSGQAADAVFGQADFNSSATAQGIQNRMVSPRGIAVDSNGRLYVADTGNNRILIYSQIGGVNGSGDSSLVQQITNSTQYNVLRSPIGVSVDPATGQIWVAEPQSGSGRILRYPEFTVLQTIPSPLADFILGTVTPPLATALDNQGRLVAAEASNRVTFYYPPVWATNAANFLPNVSAPNTLLQPCCAAGSIATLWPFSPSGVFGAIDTAGASSLPLPTALNDITLVVSGQDMPDTPAPLFMVSPGQINFQVPRNAPNGTMSFTLMRQSTGEILATGPANVNSASPALFANPSFPLPADVTKAGGIQAVGQNYGDYPKVSCNGLAGTQAGPQSCPDGVRPARRGETVVLYATGQGLVSGMPDDGTASGADQTTSDPSIRVVLSSGAQITPDFSGLAPTLVGVWQINFKVPNDTPPGAVGIAIRFKDLASSVGGTPKTFIMVQ